MAYTDDEAGRESARLDALERREREWQDAADDRLERWHQAAAAHDCSIAPGCPPRCPWDAQSPPAWFD
jgi:hypothetical protein